MNNRPHVALIVASATISVSLLACGWLIRDGLRSLSAQVRDKDLSPLPTEVHLGVGNPDIRVTFGTIRFDGPDRGDGPPSTGTLTIDNLKIELPATQPDAADGEPDPE